MTKTHISLRLERVRDLSEIASGLYGEISSFSSTSILKIVVANEYNLLLLTVFDTQMDIVM